jgi:chaperonin GroES
VKLYPLNGNVVIERLESEKTTAGAHGVKLILPDEAQKKSQLGTVLAVYEPYVDADGKWQTPRLTEGQQVLIPKYSGEEFDIGTNTYLLVKESAVLGVFRRTVADFQPAEELAPELVAETVQG